MGERRSESIALGNLGLGQFTDAVSALHQAIATRRQNGQLPLLMESLAALARVRLRQDDVTARQVMQEVFAFVQTQSLAGANQPLQISINYARARRALPIQRCVARFWKIRPGIARSFRHGRKARR